jgi:hypothetical protein
MFDFAFCSSTCQFADEVAHLVRGHVAIARPDEADAVTARRQELFSEYRARRFVTRIAVQDEQARARTPPGRSCRGRSTARRRWWDPRLADGAADDDARDARLPEPVGPSRLVTTFTSTHLLTPAARSRPRGSRGPLP